MTDIVHTKYATKQRDGFWRECYDDPRAFTTGMVCLPDSVVYELDLIECDEGDE